MRETIQDRERKCAVNSIDLLLLPGQKGKEAGMKRVSYILNGCAYGMMVLSIATRPISAYPSVQETLMSLAGLYLLISNAKTTLEGR